MVYFSANWITNKPRCLKYAQSHCFETKFEAKTEKQSYLDCLSCSDQQSNMLYIYMQNKVTVFLYFLAIKCQAIIREYK